MSNPLSQKITFFSVIKFTLPTIVMMMFMSFYTMVDGIFVSNFVSTSALSAVNIVYPMLNVVIAVAIMLATGGSAIVSKQMGEGNQKEAKSNFTMIVYLGIVIGIVISVVGLIYINPILRFLGASELIFELCHSYAFMLLIFVPMGILQMLFQQFFVTAGKPSIGLIVTIIGGIANIVLDYIFIVFFDMGIAGAALATGIGFSIPGIFGLLYFSLKRKGSLCFVKAKLNVGVILKTCSNGSSEMVTNLSIALTTLLFNLTMMRYLGENGVAAITIVLYAEYLLNAIFLGYSSGVAPLYSYNYGENNINRLKKLFKYSAWFVSLTSIIVFCSANLLSATIVGVFAKGNKEVFDIAINGMNIFSIAFLLMGSNIFISSLFTALSNGKVSALLSFLRTFLFILPMIILLPVFIGPNGVWMAVPIAEALAIAVSITFVIKKRKQYQYL